MPEWGEWDRRDFLKTLPAGALSLCLPASAAQAAAAPAALDDRLPLAYWGGRQAEAAGEEAGRVRDARSLAEGDARFLANGARLRLHGLYPSEHLWEYTGWSGFELDVIHDPEQDLRHHAWCCESRHAPNISASLSLRVPVSAEHGLQLAGALRDKTQGRTPFALRLTTGRERGAAKLRAGLYLAALQPGEAIRWRAYRLDAEASGEAGRQLHRRAVPAGLTLPAPFPYLAFSVEPVS